MPGSTAIEWTDASWNPVTGCTQVSAGCDHCYAKTFAERWRGIPGHPYEQGFDLRLWPERLTIPLRWRKPRRIFVNSMSDLFHAHVPEAFIERVFATMAACPRHTFQILTKRPLRMQAVISSPEFVAAVHHALAQIELPGTPPGCLFPPLPGWPLPNVWLGVSVESREVAWRIDWLVHTPAAIRFLSCEPLLGPLDLTPWLGCEHDAAAGTDQPDQWERDARGLVFRYVDDPQGPISLGDIDLSVPWRRVPREVVRRGRQVDWVIAGGESGPGHRPIDRDWARHLRDDCREAGIPFFFKQWGGARPKSGGRLLDGRTWDEFPASEAIR